MEEIIQMESYCLATDMNQEHTIKYSTKVAVMTSVICLFVVVGIVVAVVVTSGRNQNSGDESVTSLMKGLQTQLSFHNEEMYWKHQFAVQLQLPKDHHLQINKFSQIIAVDDLSQIYIIEINNNNFFNLYIIVDFIKRLHHYIGVEKGVNDARTNIVEKRILFCQKHPFDATTVMFTSPYDIKAQGNVFRVKMEGGVADLKATLISEKYLVSSTLMAIINGSCGSLPVNRSLQWNPPYSNCSSKNLFPIVSHACLKTLSDSPVFQETPLSSKAACRKFHTCNVFMGLCDPSWVLSQYDNRPYCLCRKTIVGDVRALNCPASIDDGGECDLPRRDIINFESNAPCYCRYRIFKIYPITNQTSGQFTWVFDINFITTPTKNFNECPGNE